jgi:uncharacterized protein YlxP (DUF503 family)
MPVTIGLLHIDLLIPGARSLKDKRRALSSLKSLLRSRYNCSVAEVDYKDKWGRGRLAVVVVSDDSAHANEQLNEIARFCGNHHAALMTNYSIELM